MVVVSVLRELVQRDGLFNALNGRDEEGLLPLLQFLVKHICNPRYAALLMGVSEVVLGTMARWLWMLCRDSFFFFLA